MLGLLATLRSMVAAGHEPDDYLLVRFTDGRTKAAVIREGAASDRLAVFRNEYGPVASALHVGATSGPGTVLLRVTDFTSRGSRWEQQGEWLGGELKWTQPIEVATAADSYSRDLRKSAILPASLGMTTGWLPNVDSSLSPAGVLS